MPSTPIELPVGVFSGAFEAEIVEVGPNVVAPTTSSARTRRGRSPASGTSTVCSPPRSTAPGRSRPSSEGLGTAIEITRPPQQVPLNAAARSRSRASTRSTWSSGPAASTWAGSRA